MNCIRPALGLWLYMVLVCLAFSPVLGDWSNDPGVNNLVCDMPGDRYVASAVPDGGGGVVLVWEDWMEAPNLDIYAQWMDAAGNRLWPAEGLPVCTLSTVQMRPRMDSDGLGGFVIAWEDYREGASRGEIFAQRITGGMPYWEPDGIRLSTSADYNIAPHVVGDGSGGIYAVWGEEINKAARGTKPEVAATPGGIPLAGNAIHAQHADADGDTLWGPGGIEVTAPGQGSYLYGAATDGEGGLLVAWVSGGIPLVQRFNAAGERSWGSSGVVVMETVDPIGGVVVVSDGAGGAIVVLQVFYGTDANIYAQRVDLLGVPRWSLTGVAVCEAADEQSNPGVVSDGQRGAIITWTDLRDGDYTDIYAQRMDMAGQPVWTADGIQISTSPDDDEVQEIVSDGDGGAIIAWQTGLFTTFHISAQRVDASGNVLWGSGGVVVSNAPGGQVGVSLASDGAGGVLAAWSDWRTFAQTSIYAQRVERNGFLGYPAPCLESVVDYPGDQGGEVIVTWEASYLDRWPDCGVDYYSVWRRYAGGGLLAFAAAGPVPFVDCATLALLEESGWTYAGEVEAWQLSGYSYVVESFGDSTAGGVPWVECLVLAHNTELDDFWMSGAVAGYSVDNIDPGAPLALVAEAVGLDASLTWSASGYHDEDLHHYDVHRSDVPGFTPDLTTFVGTAPDTFFVDVDPGAQTWYYRVVAEDVHGNEGAPSNEASADVGAGVEEPALPEALAILGASPNPLRSSARIEFALPETGRVTMAVYSVHGRRVATIVDGVMGAGHRHISWSATDDEDSPVPAGLYFIRLEAGGTTAVGKVLVIR